MIARLVSGLLVPMCIFMIGLVMQGCSNPGISLGDAVEGEWQTYTLDLNTYPYATCLDGSPGIFYVRKGAEASSVYVHFEGGGWCNLKNEPDCVGQFEPCSKRITTPLMGALLGTSKNDQGTVADAAYFSTDPNTNPFHNWTMVYLRYCDGASFSGRRMDMINGVYSRGNFILEAIMTELETPVLKPAKNVVISGDSAGGLATYLHAHQWVQHVSSSTKIGALPDSGFFQEWDSTKPAGCAKTYTQQLKDIYEESQAKDGLNPDCISEHTNEPWRCMFAAQSGPHLPMPVFMLQPKFDLWQVGSELGENIFSSSAGTLDAVNAYGAAVEKDVLATLQASQPGSGVFLDSYLHHTALGVSPCNTWTGTKINGVAMNAAVQKWLTSTMKEDGVSSSDGITWVSKEPYICASCCS